MNAVTSSNFTCASQPSEDLKNSNKPLDSGLSHLSKSTLISNLGKRKRDQESTVSVKKYEARIVKPKLSVTTYDEC